MRFRSCVPQGELLLSILFIFIHQTRAQPGSSLGGDLQPRLIVRLLPGLLWMAAVYVVPKALEANSSSEGCEDDEEPVGASPLSAIPGSQGAKPLKGGEEPAAAQGTLLSCKVCTL